MKYQEIITELKNKKYHPIYFLEGEEPYFIDRISNYIEKNVLPEEAQNFNLSVFYGKEADDITVMDTAKRFPMMAEYHVVILKEAQQMRKIENLLPYITNPSPKTIFVICYKYKTLDKRKKFSQAVIENCVVFESKKLYENQIPAWIEQYLAAKSYQIDLKACMLMTEYLGSDLSKIVNEIDKLLICTSEGNRITAEDIEKNIGISKDYNSFELQNALGKKDALKANRIINYFKANPNPNPLVITIGILFSFFSKVYLYHFSKNKSDKELSGLMKIHSFFLKDFKTAAANYPPDKLKKIFAYLQEYDLRSKGVNNVSTSDNELLKELVFKILH